MSSLARSPDTIEAEVNPLIVLPRGKGVLAVDALIQISTQ